MVTFNHVQLAGNLTRDPEVKFLDSGTAVCTFGLAVNRKYKKGDQAMEEVGFYDCEAWGKTAEICGEFLAKGRPVLVDGRLKQDRWEDDKGKHSKIKITVNEVQFLGSAEKKEGAQGAAEDAGNAGGGSAAPPAEDPDDAF